MRSRSISPSASAPIEATRIGPTRTSSSTQASERTDAADTTRPLLPGIWPKKRDVAQPRANDALRPKICQTRNSGKNGIPGKGASPVPGGDRPPGGSLRNRCESHLARDIAPRHRDGRGTEADDDDRELCGEPGPVRTEQHGCS